MMAKSVRWRRSVRCWALRASEFVKSGTAPSRSCVRALTVRHSQPSGAPTDRPAMLQTIKGARRSAGPFLFGYVPRGFAVRPPLLLLPLSLSPDPLEPDDEGFEP